MMAFLVFFIYPAKKIFFIISNFKILITQFCKIGKAFIFLEHNKKKVIWWIREKI